MKIGVPPLGVDATTEPAEEAEDLQEACGLSRLPRSKESVDSERRRCHLFLLSAVNVDVADAIQQAFMWCNSL